MLRLQVCTTHWALIIQFKCLLVSLYSTSQYHLQTGL
jgi:hypothetical protein